jgi:hypothetical protein
LLIAYHRVIGYKVLQCCEAADHYPLFACFKKRVSRTAGLHDCCFVISIRRIVFYFTFDRAGVTGLEGTGEIVRATK